MLRILPRDAFNDANLLKCIGEITLAILDGQVQWLTYDYDGEPFDIQQSEDSGATWVNNIKFKTKKGVELLHWRPVNSRNPWSLYFTIDTDNDRDDADFPVFTNDGEVIEYDL